MFDSEEAAAAAASSERYIVAKSEGEARQKAEAQYGAGVVLKQARLCFCWRLGLRIPARVSGFGAGLLGWRRGPL